MRTVSSGILSLAIAAVLTAPLGLSTAVAEVTTPPPTIESTLTPTLTESPAPEESLTPTESPTPSDFGTPSDSGTPTESPTLTESEAPVGSPPPTQSPAVTESPTPTGSASSTESAEGLDPPVIQAMAEPPAIVNDVPSISIQLPEGYTLEDLNASKDDIPADPDTEPHSMLTLVDPNDPANNLTDASLEDIHGRGNFTWTLDKKPYQIKFDSKTPLLGMDSAKKWILLANHADPSLLRNKVAYDLAEAFGLPASPDSRFVDLTINGEYLGSYLITEKVEVQTGRLELSDPGGILLELDNNYGTAEDFYFRTELSDTIFVLKDAVEDVEEPLAAPLAEAYADIQVYLDELESLLYAPDPDWAAISAMIDVESFVKYYFVFEVAENPEITQSSVFFWRDGIGDVLHAGPVWDFDSAFAQYVSERRGGDPRQDYVMNGRYLRNQGNGWYTELFRNPEFVEAVRDLYDNELKSAIDELPSNVDEYAASIPESAAANFEVWDEALVTSVFNGGHELAGTWEGEVDYLKDWVERRVEYLDTAYGVGNPMLTYAGHVQNIGWQRDMTGGQIAGTYLTGLRLEAFDFEVDENGLSGTVQSRSHVQNIGWTDWRNGDAMLGTTGRKLRLEAVQFRLTEQLAANFDLEYRVQVTSLGWMPWVTNGELAGTTGRSLPIEAIQVRFVEREPVVGSVPFYRAHVQNIGWQPTVSDGAIAGTTGRSLALEALDAYPVSTEYSGGILYRAHVQNLGWMPWELSPDYVGTVGRNLRMEAIQIELTGELAQHYSIRYQAHVQRVGWQPWVTDGQLAGTTGQSLRVEAIRIELVPKS